MQADKCATMRPTRVTSSAYQKSDGTTVFFFNNFVAHLESKNEGPERPTALLLYWPALPKVHIHLVSAILPDPNHRQNNHIHIFSDDLYVRFNDLEEKIVEGPRPIVDSWLALAEAGFRTVDAVLPCQNNTAVFFSGDRYAIITFEILEKGHRSHLTESGTLASRWPLLSEFKFIDYTLPEPETGRLLFFLGEEYISVEEALFRQHMDIPLSRSPCVAGTLNSQDPAIYTGNKSTLLKGSLPEKSNQVTRGSIASQWAALTRVGFD